MSPRFLAAPVCAFGLGVSCGLAAAPSFLNFETAPVHPLALSPDGATLAVCDLPDARVELFDVSSSGGPRHLGHVAVGPDRVSVRFCTTNEVQEPTA